MRQSKRRTRHGFTLIELIAALSITGIALLGGVLLLDQLTDSSGRIVSSGSDAAREGNSDRVLRHLFLDARITADSADRFRGDQGSMDFSTMCARPGGWIERCRATIAVDRRPDTSVVVAALSTGERLQLIRLVGPIELRYFDVSASDTSWRNVWAISITRPAAIGFVGSSDTVVFPLGTERD